MDLQGKPIKVGDSVYDIVRGSGMVTFIDTRHIAVKFTDRFEANYDASGKTRRQPKPTLFHSAPLLIQTPRDSAQRLLLTQAINGMLDGMDLPGVIT